MMQGVDNLKDNIHTADREMRDTTGLYSLLENIYDIEEVYMKNLSNYGTNNRMFICNQTHKMNINKGMTSPPGLVRPRQFQVE